MKPYLLNKLKEIINKNRCKSDRCQRRCNQFRRPRLLLAQDRSLRSSQFRIASISRVELELQDERQEVARVRRVTGNMVLGARVEVGLGARHRRTDALVLLAQLPPCRVVVGGRHLPGGSGTGQQRVHRDGPLLPGDARGCPS